MSESTTSADRPGITMQVINTILLTPSVVREPTDYEPAEHRSPNKQLKYFQTWSIFINESIGSGILSMPNAFSLAGYKIGVIGTILAGCMCTYCLRTVLCVQYELCRRTRKPSMTYKETAEASLKEGPECCQNIKFFGIISIILVLVYELCCTSLYMVFVAKNVKRMLEYHVDITIHVIIYMAAVMLLLFITALCNNLKVIAVLSLFANVSMLIAFCILGYYIAMGNPTFEDRIAVGQYQDILYFIGTETLAVESIGSVLPLENEMERPLDFTGTFGVLYVAMVPTVALYAIVGLCGYLSYGAGIQSYITVNLPQHEILANVCNLLFVFGIYTTIVLLIFMMYEMIWAWYIVNNDVGSSEDSSEGSDNDTDSSEDSDISMGAVKSWWIQFGIRILFGFLTFFISAATINMEFLISLIGSLAVVTTGILFPALFNLFVYWDDYRGVTFAWYFIWCFMLMIYGLFLCIIAVDVTVRYIYEKVWSKYT